MIAVICDDFTGAAELAGIALRYQLSVQLCLENVIRSTADVFIVCTDSRSMNTHDAEKITATTLNELKRLKPALIYKKIDSVFRGHVLEELRIQMQVESRSKALVVAANPSLGRTIRDGHYFINEKPLEQSSFSTDPDFPVMTSDVKKMFSGNIDDITMSRPVQKVVDGKIFIGELSSVHDLTEWAKLVDDSTTIAGGGDFFEAVLKRDRSLGKIEAGKISLPFLYVSGTTFKQSRELIKELSVTTSYVFYLPAEMLMTGRLDHEWIETVTTTLTKHGKCIIAVDEEITSKAVLSQSVKTTLSTAAVKIINMAKIKELFVEGGATAAAILDSLECKMFEPIAELSRGVVRMKSIETDLLVTVKPGSYDVDSQISKLFQS